MSDILKYALIGGAIYLAWPYITGTSTAAAATTTTGTTAVPAGPILLPAQSQLQTLTNALGTQGPRLLETAANVATGQTYTIGQWNYYLPVLMPGITQPSLVGYLAGSSNPTTTYTADQYWAGLVLYASGAAPSLSGLSRGNARTQNDPRFDLASMVW